MNIQSSSPSRASIVRGVLMLGLLAGMDPLSAAVVSDSFDDGGLTDGGDLLDIAWLRSTGGTASVVSTVAAGALIEGNNALFTDPGNNTFLGMYGQFASQALGVGDTITLSFDFALRGVIGNNGNGLRFGLGNANGTTGFAQGNNTDRADDHGYRATVSTGTSGAQTAIFRDGPANDGNLLGGTDGADITGAGELDLVINDTNTRSALLSITRSGMAEMTISTTIYSAAGLSGSVVGSASAVEAQNDAQYYTFNQVGIGRGSVTTDLTFDNVVVNVVPEPGIAALLGGSVLLAVFGRRRSR